jgi:nucleotide-binding universal stress UspA family protein
MKILVATDGSKNALRAVKFAIKLVKESSLKTNSVTVISVHDDAGLRHARTFVGSDAISDYLRELSDKELKSAVKALDDAGVKHTKVIKTGHVAEEICNLAQKEKFDMVVLGSKGRSALADLLIGSVAQRVIASVKQPVVLIK